jgi:hypothetical protein
LASILLTPGSDRNVWNEACDRDDPGIDSTAFSLVPLLGWAERHERAQIDDPGEPSSAAG